MTQDFYVTSEGLKELKEELKVLVDVKRPELIDRVATARAHGDLSENSEYAAATQDLAFAEGRMEELEELIAKAQIIKSGKNANHIVKLGSKVVLKTNGKSQTFELVGEWEANPLEQKISHTSPLGRALLGKKMGEQVEIDAPAGRVKYHIVKVH
ncbi:transcription elongation factor GreA [Candidatus Beckwithbacteria bacterium CG22_combo_CG10-13_8_21_14_all_01_47_9]|uniref:Transcription elongation factor GreA n=4 Tax=Candidatus Beckwithiibacteriota TaxID=1752726 RepID=A0A2H0E0N9_9BACT|nr:MAG: transcription elongation factor GreA [Candidatus Beckwithbacteria bacterium CG22_combo_CG10-13_8_21_14_all_01_47_9]PJA22986.1 MAG: transcription elongation factor GreA [Candidatus Beckwithbacteria bacterium CG_4_10_14_0_2_um_filter_47_25]PJC66188.1 MAG: transcription elongation factor GreA [Candidatus Beckwithbacteria bacterium CG_4_9_14_0_2_um_filter_47_11]